MNHNDFMIEQFPKTRNLLAAIVRQAFCDLEDKKDNTHYIIEDAIRFLKDEYLSSVGLTASEIIDVLQCDEKLWKEVVKKKIKEARIIYNKKRFNKKAS